VVVVAVAALGTLALLVRAVLVRGEPWWSRWPAVVGGLLVVLSLLAGAPRPATALGALVLLVGLVLQLVWSYRRGRYLEDDVAGLWRRLRGRPEPARRRHRARDED
jgi:hypothetical protein